MKAIVNSILEIGVLVALAVLSLIALAGALYLLAYLVLMAVVGLLAIGLFAGLYWLVNGHPWNEHSERAESNETAQIGA